MGKTMSMLNPFRNYNIEGRAHKIISQSKPSPAPKHKSDMLDYERILKDHPDIIEQAAQKNPELDKHLRDVYVTSKDVILDKIKNNPDRPLPLDRLAVEDFEYGFKEPIQVPVGKITLRNALKFISDHQNDPKINTVQKLASDYNLVEETVKNILQYYRVFEIYVPLERKTKAKFAGPGQPKIEIRERAPKLLDSSKFEKKDDT